MPNPFSTRHTRAGSIRFELPPGESLQDIADRFRHARWVGQIVGPHGSGKSTLALEIARLIREPFEQFRHLTIRQNKDQVQIGQVLNLQIQEIDRATHQLFVSEQPLDPLRRTLFLFDGWARVSRLNRYLFIQNCKKMGHGLLVTSHLQKSRLPVMFLTQPDKATFCRIVRQLQQDSFFELDGKIAELAFDQAEGNYREAFMRLYDAYEVEKRYKLQDSSLDSSIFS